VQSTLCGNGYRVARSLRPKLKNVNGTDVTFGHASFVDMVGASSELGLTTTYGQRLARGGGWSIEAAQLVLGHLPIRPDFDFMAFFFP
jgi:hypothetical protein